MKNKIHIWKKYLVNDQLKLAVSLYSQYFNMNYDELPEYYKNMVSFLLTNGFKFSKTHKGYERYNILYDEKIKKIVKQRSKDIMHGGEKKTGDIAPRTREDNGDKENSKKKNKGQSINGNKEHKKKRTHRGRRRRNKKTQKILTVNPKNITKQSNTPVAALTSPEKLTEEEIKAVKQAAKIFATWVGQGKSVEEEIDVVGFVKANIVGENPLPYLREDIESEHQPNILISPDLSGSTHGWSHIALAFAIEVQKYFPVKIAINYNGIVVDAVSPNWEETMHLTEVASKEKVDIVLYLGDSDVLIDSKRFELNKYKFVILNNEKCNIIDPRIVPVKSLKSTIMIEGVKGDYIWDYIKAFRLLSI